MPSTGCSHQKGLEESGHITTIVDNSAAVENVTKLAKNKGCTVQMEEKEGITTCISVKAVAMFSPQLRNRKRLLY